MRSSTCSAYKHLTFIPYALANVVEDEGDFTVAEGHGHPLVPVIAEQCNYLLLLLLLLHSTSGLNNWTQEKNDLKLELFTSLVIKRGPE
jgi:hypothetical protein